MCKWIKANERLPEMQKRVVLKHIGANTVHLGNFDSNEEGAWLYIQCSEVHAGWSIPDEGSNFENWEWLDESNQESQPEQKPDEDELWEKAFHDYLHTPLTFKSKYHITRKL